jgi:unsaturated rhamnogalacturonyl hydrolase
MRKIVIAAALFLTAAVAIAQTPAKQTETAWSVRMADSAMAKWPICDTSVKGSPRWIYETGTLLEGMDDVWHATADPKYYTYIKSCVDAQIDKDGNVTAFQDSQHTLDDVLMGRMALLMYNVTLDKRYYVAAKQMRTHLDTQPRTQSGGFWHKQRYPEQMWLDGLYMAEPFYAEYAKVFQEPKDWDDIALQFELSEKHLRDPKTGLLYHGWDESKKQKWADPVTGDSAEFWSRGMGWYMMALVDVLDYFPESNPHHANLVAILNRLATAIAKQQDAKTGVWYQVTNKPTAKGNYLESSSSAMFVYAMNKGVRNQELPWRFHAVAEKGYAGILKQFITTDDTGHLHMSNMVGSAGLGGDPYRSGTYEYYVGEKTVSDDAKGIGAFLMASTEADRAKTVQLGLGQVAMVDAWYNSQTRVNAAGETESFHYKWGDEANSGYAFWGHDFHTYGVKTETLTTAPTLAALKHAQMYIIASPDIPAKNPNPHYVAPQDVREVKAWVRQGGVLVLMPNDGTSSEFEHFNTLAAAFGLHFNPVNNNQVPGHDEEMGRLLVPEGNPIFAPKKIFMKEICSITPVAPAKGIMTWQGNTVMAVAKVGKGTVYAVVDPWLYDEYTDGRKIPMDFENNAAAKELVRWLVKQVPVQESKTK